MKIGVIADTHDNLMKLRQTLDRFREAGVEHILHAGDICSPFVFLDFKKHKIPFSAVFGNNDGEWLFLVKLAEGLGRMVKGPIELELGGRKLALMHEPAFLDALADSGHFDLIVYGHTHQPEQKRRGKALILNPGENCGYLKNRATAAIVDLDDLSTDNLVME